MTRPMSCSGDERAVLQAGGTFPPRGDSQSAASPATPFVPVRAAVASIWTRGPEGREYGIGSGTFPLVQLAQFESAHPEAVAVRQFVYERDGFEHADVDVPCLHWLDPNGRLRVTTLLFAKTIGTCRTCCGDRAHLANDCPSCEGTKLAPLYLPCGLTFIEPLMECFGQYWKLTKAA
jgi:hypothetical protein